MRIRERTRSDDTTHKMSRKPEEEEAEADEEREMEPQKEEDEEEAGHNHYEEGQQTIMAYYLR